MLRWRGAIMVSCSAETVGDTLEGVVVVHGEQEASTGRKGVRLPHVLQRGGRVLREDRRVLPFRVEPPEHRPPRLLDEAGHPRRGQAGGVRVAEDVAVEEAGVRADLRLGVKAAAGVIEIDMPLLVEAPVLRRPQLVEDAGVGVVGKLAQELGVGVRTAHLFIMDG